MRPQLDEQLIEWMADLLCFPQSLALDYSFSEWQQTKGYA